MRILTLENKCFNLDDLPDKLEDDIRFSVLDNSDTGNDFSVYEFEWIGADGERAHGVSEHGERAHSVREHGEHGHKEKQEEKDPEFVEYAINMTALDAGKFLRERISEGYYPMGKKASYNDAVPNVKIVFIRIIGQRENGAREYTTEATVFNALQWVADNQAKFNIQSVAMAQGSHYLGAAGTDYCPKTPTTVAKVKALNSMNVGVFFPAGNNRDYQRIDWPACIPETIAVGATMPDNSVASYSNYDPLLVDFHARGTIVLYGINAKKTNFAGSSASVLVAATSWATVKAAKSQLGYTDLYNLLLKTSTPTRNSKIAKANLINIQAALNG